MGSVNEYLNSVSTVELAAGAMACRAALRPASPCEERRYANWLTQLTLSCPGPVMQALAPAADDSEVLVKSAAPSLWNKFTEWRRMSR